MPRKHAPVRDVDEPRTPPRARPPALADQVTDLQHMAGNRAVARIVELARQPDAGGATKTMPAPKPPNPVRRKEIDKPIEETISHAPAAFAADWNKTFRWQAKWRLKLDMRPESAQLNVKVRLFSTATSELKRKWARAIRRKWDNRFAFAVKRDTPVEISPGVLDEYEEQYPIRVEIEWVDDVAKAHYEITPNAPGAAVAGTVGLGGTTSMVGWGTADTVDITHEFGHMLGCPEEYFTTNGFDWSFGGRRRGFRDPGGGVMNNPAGPALARNFNLIRKEGAKLRGVKLAKTKVIPWQP